MPWWQLHAKKLRYRLIFSREIDDQRILQSDCGLNGHTQTKAVVSDATFPWWLSPCKNFKIPIGSFQRYSWSKIPTTWLDERQNWPSPTKSSSFRCYLFTWWLTPCNETKILIDFFQIYWWSKNPAICLNEKHNCPHSIKSGVLWCQLPLMIISMQKILEIDWFLPEILMIKESYNLIEREAQLATSNKKWHSQMLPALLDYLCAKNQRDQLTPSRDIGDQIIL